MFGEQVTPLGVQLRLADALRELLAGLLGDECGPGADHQAHHGGPDECASPPWHEDDRDECDRRERKHDDGEVDDQRVDGQVADHVEDVTHATTPI